MCKDLFCPVACHFCGFRVVFPGGTIRSKPCSRNAAPGTGLFPRIPRKFIAMDLRLIRKPGAHSGGC